MKVKNILAVRNDRFGEFLLNIPALRALKEAYPQAKLTLAVNPYVVELAECIENVDEILPWENRKHKFSEILKFSRKLKAKKFDLCVIFNPSKEFNIISFLAGIPQRVGYNRKLGILLTHKIEDKKHLGEKHEVDYNLELAGLAGGRTDNRSLSLKIGEEALRDFPWAADLKDNINLIAVHPWTSDPVKQWPVENFYTLAKKLAALPDTKVVIIGGREELNKGGCIFSTREDNFINLTGKTGLKQLAAILKKCKLLVSGDSGPMHLAAAVKTPVIAIFRSDMPEKCSRRWGPWGSGHAVIEKDNLLKITVDEIFHKTEEVLKK